MIVAVAENAATEISCRPMASAAGARCVLAPSATAQQGPQVSGFRWMCKTQTQQLAGWLAGCHHLHPGKGSCLEAKLLAHAAQAQAAAAGAGAGGGRTRHQTLKAD